MQKAASPTKFLAVEKDLELKAYIYQQLVDIQPYLVADSQVSVAVQEVKEIRTPKTKAAKTKKEILVTLTASVEEGEMEVEGQGADFYQAFGLAKEKIVHQLSELQNSMMDVGEREMMVQSALNGGMTIH